jgi:hypothetical protein
MSAEVAHLKRQHAEELAAAEQRQTELVRAVQSQLDEISKLLEEVHTQSDLTLIDLRAA